MRLVLCLLMSIMLSSCASVIHSQEYFSGKRAFANGDFKIAYHNLLSAASDGKPEAQYAIGYMTYYGYGTSQDSSTGIFWMERAAAQHYPPAVKALNLINSGREHNDKLLVKT